MQKVRAIEEICERHGVQLRAAALQFVLAHPIVERVVIGFAETAHIDGALQAASQEIPNDVWIELKEALLIHEACPIPAGE